MWYGKRALIDKEGDVRVVSGQDAERNRQTQVDQDKKKPPPEWQDLLQDCLDEEVDKRPDAQHVIRGWPCSTGTQLHPFEL